MKAAPGVVAYDVPMPGEDADVAGTNYSAAGFSSSQPPQTKPMIQIQNHYDAEQCIGSHRITLHLSTIHHTASLHSMPHQSTSLDLGTAKEALTPPIQSIFRQMDLSYYYQLKNLELTKFSRLFKSGLNYFHCSILLFPVKFWWVQQGIAIPTMAFIITLFENNVKNALLLYLIVV
ncbi:hypothetical protein EGR_09004 [Echinococcus granulosus]|uniref:Uncharacterized protein n=1 Tax=Echinococcus granulosus TaxID=6210 RepID=W6UCV2_ECHGR|nr:hypothetical protein EGR_09004 [Echinococcus granulosus]EUB56112.1 hypothetical protein EGR_09004 [Echinococcus granulosus]